MGNQRPYRDPSTFLNRELFQNLRGSPDRLKDEDICYNNKMMNQIEYDER